MSRLAQTLQRRSIPLFDFSISGANSPAISTYRELVRRAKGPLLSIDVGTRHVGLSLSDNHKRFAFPLSAYKRRGTKQDASHIENMCKGSPLSGLVIGLPIFAAESSTKRLCNVFESYVSELLLEEPIREMEIASLCYWNEAYTSMDAREALGRNISRRRRNKWDGEKHNIDQV